MKISDREMAALIAEALPHVQKYIGQVVVIKYGGNAMKSASLKAAVMHDLTLLSMVGIKVVLVHGGGPEITATLKAMGKESRFIDGLRYTDAETAAIAQMVLAGRINKELVGLLGQNGVKAVGLCGLDDRMLQCEKHMGKVDLGFVGDVVQVNTELLEITLQRGYIPVIATVGCDREGNVYNINADTVAAQIAAALHAKNLILMTDVRGLLRDKEDESTLIPQVGVSEVPLLVREGIISGGMIPKIECCVETIRRGVDQAVIIDGRIEHSILIEMFSNEGSGTMFTSESGGNLS